MSPEEAYTFMRKNMVISLKTPDGLELTLDPRAFEPAPLPEDPEADGGPDLDVVGSTGMTRRQQIDLLGEAVEADFRPAPAKTTKKRA